MNTDQLTAHTNNTESQPPFPTVADTLQTVSGTPLEPLPKKSARLHSLDALRGFDMFWIMGGANVIHAATKYFDWGVLHAINDQLTHVEWNGFAFYDMVFPLFLFIAGVAMPFSLTKRLDRGEDKKKLMRHVIVRGLILVALGLIMSNGLFQKTFSEMRFATVLGRIGLAYMFAGLIVLNTKLLGQILSFLGILLVYWAMMTLIPVPGHGAGVLTMEGNLASYLDRQLLPGKLYKGIHDPEGILSTFPAIATALLGALTGILLSPDNRRFQPWMKAVLLALAGVFLLWIGKLWDPWFPINKNLWSSSFVVYVGGWCLIFLSAFYFVIDVLGFKKWAFFFTVIGLNPILIFLAPRFVDFNFTANKIFGGFSTAFVGNFNYVFMALALLLVKWLLLYFLWRNKVFLRV